MIIWSQFLSHNQYSLSANSFKCFVKLNGADIRVSVPLTWVLIQGDQIQLWLHATWSKGKRIRIYKRTGSHAGYMKKLNTILMISKLKDHKRAWMYPKKPRLTIALRNVESAQWRQGWFCTCLHLCTETSVSEQNARGLLTNRGIGSATSSW